MAFNAPLVDDEIPSSAKWNTAVAVYDRNNTEIDVVNTVTETTVYSKSITAGHMSTDRTLRLELSGDYLNNSGATRDVRIRVKFGGTVIWNDDATFVVSANRRRWRIEVNITNLDAANSQDLDGLFFASSATAPTNGIGEIDEAPATTGKKVEVFGQSADPAIDTSVAVTLAVTAENNAANASLSFRKKKAILYLD